MRPSTIDYSNRQVDIEWLQTIFEPSVDPVQLNLNFSTNSKIVTGMQKLAQRFTNVFLTFVGDVYFDPTYGTTFWKEILGGATQNIGKVKVVVVKAIAQAKRIVDIENLDVDTFGDVPSDERLSKVQVLDVSIDRFSGTVSIQLEIRNVEGDAYTYVIPVQAVRV